MKHAIFLLALAAIPALAQEPVSISGIYPHLSAYNANEKKPAGYGECGIGAVVPWAGKLWYLTYPPHEIHGSSDLLYSVDEKMTRTIQPESVGGTHANRMIHRESNQLIIGPYFISADGKVRVCDVKTQLVGRLTATARHLTDPANKVLFYDMEGKVYEVDVHTLAVKKLFEKPVPGWHGKGGYTSQDRFVVSNNGEDKVGGVKPEFLAKLPPPSPEDAGVLAEWDGKEWRIVERKQFTDVTGPGGINGASDDKSPLWAMGWDKRSVILKLLDGGEWSTYRVPKGSAAFDPRHGWYTEWPRIREVGGGKMLMVMHGQMFDFPKTFSRANSGGIRPVCTHLRYIPDFCDWNGRLVLAADDTSIMQNTLAGVSHSNLQFTTVAALKDFGPRAGWGGVWFGDSVKSNTPSDPFLFAGYEHRSLHLWHNDAAAVTFTVEIDEKGDGKWSELEKIEVPANGYKHREFDTAAKGEWIRFRSDRDVKAATAYFHVATPASPAASAIGASLAKSGETPMSAKLRPASNRNLLVLTGENAIWEIDEKLKFATGTSAEGLIEGEKKPRKDVKSELDASSVIVTDPEGKRWRLPKTDDAFDATFAATRGLREVESERYMANWHGLFYELPRGTGDVVDVRRLRPVCAHRRAISDYCSWRGLLVLAGVRPGAEADAHTFLSPDKKCALWFGAVDDLWQLGKATGHGGPWRDTAVKADEASEPFLMTNFDRKRVHLQHDRSAPVRMAVEVDFTNTGAFRAYQIFDVPAGAGLDHEFPAGYSAHWVRVVADRACKATAEFTYE